MDDTPPFRRGRAAAGPATARSAAFLSAALLVLAAAPPALAADRIDDGENPGSPLGLLTTVLLFVGVPVVIFVSIAGLVLLSVGIRGPRYRPTQGWPHDPVWFAGPEDPAAAVAALPAAPVRRDTQGGAGGEW